MQDGIDQKQVIRSRRARLVTLATLAGGVLVAGCGGSSTTPPATTAGSTAAGASAASGRHATSAGSQISGGSGPLAYASCMRANGVPNFPDPQPGGGVEVRAGTGLDPVAPAFRAAQSKCQKLLGGRPVGGPLILGATTHPSPQTLGKLVRIARCMRQHGILSFPDPRTSIPSNPAALGITQITDYDGVILLFPATMNLQAPAYSRDLAACGAPPLGLPH